MADAESIVLCVADPDSQVDLVSEMAVDPMEGEQTWPTDEELAEATSNAGTIFMYKKYLKFFFMNLGVYCQDKNMLFTHTAMVKSKTMVRVPKGTSSYQAAWITDAPVIEESDGSEASEDYADNMVNILCTFHCICLRCNFCFDFLGQPVNFKRLLRYNRELLWAYTCTYTCHMQ